MVSKVRMIRKQTVEEHEDVAHVQSEQIPNTATAEEDKGDGDTSSVDGITPAQSEFAGCVLSRRMAEPGNLWRILWDDDRRLGGTAPCPACEQAPLFDYTLEAERVLHFLETLPPFLLTLEVLLVQASTVRGKQHVLYDACGINRPFETMHD